MNQGSSKEKNGKINFVVSVAVGVILYISLPLLGDKPTMGNESAIIAGIMRAIFSSAAAGLVAGFFAGKNKATSIKAACLAATIGFIASANIYLGYSVWSLLRPEIIPTLLILTIPAIIGGAAGCWIRKHRPY